MKIAVIGGGASGMMSAIICARNGADVVLFEKNEKLGKKIYITGKGRCNLTNACPVQDYLDNVVTNSKFLYSSAYKFDSYDTMDFFEALGLQLVTERGNRVFPASQKASDVTKAMEIELAKQKVVVLLKQEVLGVAKNGEQFEVVTDKRGKEAFDKVIIATGGYSYQSTGSTGDGYNFAKKMGHKIEKPKQALVSLHTKQDVSPLEGLSLKNVSLKAYADGKFVCEEFGEMLFTRRGLSGPISLSTSSKVNDKKNVSFVLDLKPALDDKTLDNRLIRELEDENTAKVFGAVRGLMPVRLADWIFKVTKIDSSKPSNIISKEEREKIGFTIKNLHFDLKCLGGFEEAIITKGGVSVKDLKPTMESKLVQGLYFVGETVDVDAYTGGFNLQIAFSTGYMAGINATK